MQAVQRASRGLTLCLSSSVLCTSSRVATTSRITIETHVRLYNTPANGQGSPEQPALGRIGKSRQEQQAAKVTFVPSAAAMLSMHRAERSWFALQKVMQEEWNSAQGEYADRGGPLNSPPRAVDESEMSSQAIELSRRMQVIQGAMWTGRLSRNLQSTMESLLPQIKDILNAYLALEDPTALTSRLVPLITAFPGTLRQSLTGEAYEIDAQAVMSVPLKHIMAGGRFNSVIAESMVKFYIDTSDNMDSVVKQTTDPDMQLAMRWQRDPLDTAVTVLLKTVAEAGTPFDEYLADKVLALAERRNKEELYKAAKPLSPSGRGGLWDEPAEWLKKLRKAVPFLAGAKGIRINKNPDSPLHALVDALACAHLSVYLDLPFGREDGSTDPIRQFMALEEVASRLPRASAIGLAMKYDMSLFPDNDSLLQAYFDYAHERGCLYWAEDKKALRLDDAISRFLQSSGKAQKAALTDRDLYDAFKYLVMLIRGSNNASDVASATRIQAYLPVNGRLLLYGQIGADDLVGYLKQAEQHGLVSFEKGFESDSAVNVKLDLQNSMVQMILSNEPPPRSVTPRGGPVDMVATPVKSSPQPSVDASVESGSPTDARDRSTVRERGQWQTLKRYLPLVDAILVTRYPESSANPPWYGMPGNLLYREGTAVERIPAGLPSSLTRLISETPGGFTRYLQEAEADGFIGMSYKPDRTPEYAFLRDERGELYWHDSRTYPTKVEKKAFSSLAKALWKGRDFTEPLVQLVANLPNTSRPDVYRTAGGARNFEDFIDKGVEMGWLMRPMPHLVKLKDPERWMYMRLTRGDKAAWDWVPPPSWKERESKFSRVLRFNMKARGKQEDKLQADLQEQSAVDKMRRTENYFKERERRDRLERERDDKK